MPDNPNERRTAEPQTIRVFVSSTFRDMHAERDYLSRVVCPELRSRCLKRGAEVIGFDLRWGVTEQEAETSTKDSCQMVAQPARWSQVPSPSVEDNDARSIGRTSP